jgi:hypothetical protein
MPVESDESTHHGFKRITESNWKEMDEIIQFPSPVTAESWLRACLKPQVKSSAPEEIAALFEVARGSMIYGWFFYPLITLASEQVYRVLEAAARLRCLESGITPSKLSKKGKPLKPDFAQLISALIRRGFIFPTERGRWEAARRLRNSASHPLRQAIISAGMSLDVLESSAELLNKLFP